MKGFETNIRKKNPKTPVEMYKNWVMLPSSGHLVADIPWVPK